MCGEPKQGFKRNMPVEAAIIAKNEFIEISVDVLAALCRGSIVKINSAIFPGLQGWPLMHVIAAKAVAFGEALRPEFKLYARAEVSVPIQHRGICPCRKSNPNILMVAENWSRESAEHPAVPVHPYSLSGRRSQRAAQSDRGWQKPDDRHC
jgi:hypothetical protein